MSASSSLIPILLLVVAAAVVIVGVQAVRRRQSGTGGLRDFGRYQEDELVQEERIAPTVDEFGGMPSSEEKPLQVKKRKAKKRKEPTIEEQLFMAGKLSARERADYHRKRKMAPFVFAAVGAVIGVVFGSFKGAMWGAIIGVILGVYLPRALLSRWVEQHHEELSYYLPLMIEQIAIGVSSSLDIGPCIARIIEMSDERASHNAATRLLKYALFYVRSGVSLEEALIEIGNSSRHPEFKHTMLALSQVTKFGGEISRQLQDLADSVGAQREAKVEARIRKLELKASGPVGLVFVAYMVLLGLGIAAQALKNLPSFK